MRCLVNNAEVNYPCSAGCHLFGDCVSAFNGDQSRVRTNADHIRSMTDMELASVIVRYEGTELHATRWGGHKHFFFGADGKRSKTRKEVVRSWADWLNQPYKEG